MTAKRRKRRGGGWPKFTCRKCGGQDSAVIRSRGLKSEEGVRRRRRCLDCGHRFRTTERLDDDFATP